MSVIVSNTCVSQIVVLVINRTSIFPGCDFCLLCMKILHTILVGLYFKFKLCYVFAHPCGSRVPFAGEHVTLFTD